MKQGRFYLQNPLVQTQAATLLLGTLLLTGCGDPNLGDLREFVADARDSSMGKELEPPPDIVPYRPFTYTAQGLKDPFVTSRFAQPQSPPEEELATIEAIDSGVRPDPNRPREELEKYSLGSLQMMGTFSNAQGDLWALVKAPDGLIYRVQEGNYLGSDHGQVVNITEQRIDLTEIVPDGEAGWRNRDAFLSLAEE
jgi:type IV pilus assembly protein PilP